MMKWMMGLLVGLFVMCVMALPVSAQEAKKEEPKKEEPKKEEAKPEDGLPPLPERPKSLEEAVKKADLILVGIVDYVGDKPGAWGTPPYRPATQFIRYEVVKFLKGQRAEKKITVLHELFKGSKTAAEQPELNSKIFDMDKKVILLLGKDPVDSNPITFLGEDPDFGAIPWTEEEEKKIGGMIK